LPASPLPAGAAGFASSSSGSPRSKLGVVVLFFEIMLVAAVVLIAWFALYVLYRLLTDES